MNTITAVGTDEVLATFDENRKCLTRADLQFASLCGDFDGFDFSAAYMNHAVARRGSFAGAYFANAVCLGVDFSNAYLRRACFAGAALHGAKLTAADCRGASFVQADFFHTDVTDTDFTGADFYGAKNLETAYGIEKHIAVPEGELVGYKIVYVGDQGPDQFALAKLIIPPEARRVRGVGSDIIRADRANVWDIEGLVTGRPYSVGRSWRKPSFVYRIGKLETPVLPFDSRITEHSGSGIHLHLDAAAAIAAFRLLQKGLTPCK